MQNKYEHIRDRLMERYGLPLSEQDYDDLKTLVSLGHYDIEKKTLHGWYIYVHFKAHKIYLFIKDLVIHSVLTKNQVEKDISSRYHKTQKEYEKLKKRENKEVLKFRGNRKKFNKWVNKYKK